MIIFSRLQKELKSVNHPAKTCIIYRKCDFFFEDLPSEEHAVWHTRPSAAVLVTGNTLIRPRAPAAVRRAQGVTRTALLNCRGEERQMIVVK